MEADRTRRPVWSACLYEEEAERKKKRTRDVCGAGLTNRSNIRQWLHWPSSRRRCSICGGQSSGTGRFIEGAIAGQSCVKVAAIDWCLCVDCARRDSNGDCE